MHVKVGDKIYKDQDQPVGIILTAQDRLNIMAMDPKRNFYCSFPNGTKEEVIKEFMTLPQPVETKPKRIAPAPAPAEEKPAE